MDPITHSQNTSQRREPLAKYFMTDGGTFIVEYKNLQSLEVMANEHYRESLLEMEELFLKQYPDLVSFYEESLSNYPHSTVRRYYAKQEHIIFIPNKT